MLFTDESKFCVFGSSGRQYVWRASNTEFNKENTRPTVKHGGQSVMVWGCMSAAGVENLHFVEGRMDKYQYINILKQNVRQSAEKLGILDNFALYADNDPKHSAYISRLWVLYNCPYVLSTPAQSPDLNVIEHLWEELGRRLQNRRFSSLRELKRGILDEWNNIPPEVCMKLVASIPHRLREVERQKGYATKY